MILEKVTPARKRALHAEVMHGSLNYKKYLEQYRVEIAGLVPGKIEREVNHCWRFIRRAVSCFLTQYCFPHRTPTLLIFGTWKATSFW